MKIAKTIFMLPIRTVYALAVFIASLLSILTCLVFLAIVALGLFTYMHKNDPIWMSQLSDFVHPITDMIQNLILTTIH